MHVLSKHDSSHTIAPRRTILLALAACGMLLGFPSGMAWARVDADESSAPLVFRQEASTEFPPLDDPPLLESPFSCFENFVLAGMEEEWTRAARSLNFRLIRDDLDVERARELARKLYFVLNQELWIDWTSLPARPDGMVDETTMGAGSQPLVGQARRGILIGRIEVDGREVPIRLHRVRAGEADPVWLFAAHTVLRIDELYERHGPSWLARSMPEWAQTRWWLRTPVWQWIAILSAVFVALILGVAAGPLSLKLLSRLGWITDTQMRSFRLPIATTVATFVLWIVVEWLLGLPGALSSIIGTSTLILFMLSATWLAARITARLFDTVARDVIDGLHNDDTPARQRVLTQITVGRHVLLLIVAMIAAGILLHELDLFRTAALALLTSAGAAAVLLGIAGHAVLGNLIAGVQIAATQPFQIGDVVYVLDNWGTIEDITYTYVTVRTWDERRLVIPIRKFVTEPIENWSKNDPFLVKPIYLSVDFRADVDRIREAFLEKLADEDDWARDRDEPKVLVTEFDDETMQVRLTCGGNEPSAAWRLYCRMSERMMAWLRDVEDGAWLPRRRLVVDSPTGALPEVERTAKSTGESES